MVVTRSMSGTTQRDQCQRAEVTNAKSQEVDVENSVKHKYALRATRKSAKSTRFCDFDETTLALGIFLDTWKKERQKNDQDFRFTRESYQAATRDFNSLNDSSKAAYIAEAKERNSLGISAIPVRPRKKHSKPRKSDLHRTLDSNANDIFMRALIQEYRNLNGIKTFPEELGDAGMEEFTSLSDEDKAPYIAQAMREYPDEPAYVWKCIKTVHGGVEKNVYYTAWP